MNTLEQPEACVDKMLGNSPKMQELLSRMRRVAVTDLPVLLVGEKGTGRSLAARIIHELSSRHKDPFTRMDCSVTPADALIDAEPFRLGKLAFSGACTQRKGHVQLSHAGSLFLNRIDALPLQLQAAVVYYLDEKLTMRVGDGSRVISGTRLIAAIDQDPKEAIAKGSFLDDLYISFVVIRVPALRERVSDILLLADAFLKKFAGAHGKHLSGFSKDAEDAMMTYPWPGNVRELEYRIMRAAAMAEGLNITSQDLEFAGIRYMMGVREGREVLQKEWITNVLARCEGNITRAAKQLGVTRPTLYDLMHKFGLSRP